MSDNGTVEDKQSLEELKKLLLRAPNDTNVLWELGQLSSDSGDLNSAINYFRRIVELEPHDDESQHALGANLLKSGLITEALNVLIQAVEAAPRTPEYRASLAEAFINAGLKSRAVEEVRKARSLLLPGELLEDRLTEFEALANSFNNP